MRSKRTRIIVTGGLGNQLFQYIAGLALSNGGDLRIDTTLGNMRNAFEGSSPIERIKLSNNVSFEESRGFKKVNTRMYLYLLRLSVMPTKLESSKFWRFLVEMVSSIYFSITFCEILRVNVALGSGYSGIVQSRINTLNIGYYQSYRYFELVGMRSKFELIHLKASNTLNNLLENSRNKKILVIHVRLGDYLYESKFGNLGPSYYERALTLQMKDFDYNEIWVFSEDASSAKKYLPEVYIPKCKFIEDIDSDEIYSLLAMTRADGFVMANSSFSWWGATLARSSSTRIVSPVPWFQNLEDPREISPKSWKKIAAY